MTSEEEIEEILYEAHAYGVRNEVMNRAKELRETFPKLDRLQSYHQAFRFIVESKDDVGGPNSHLGV